MTQGPKRRWPRARSLARVKELKKIALSEGDSGRSRSDNQLAKPAVLSRAPILCLYSSSYFVHINQTREENFPTYLLRQINIAWGEDYAVRTTYSRSQW